VHELVTIDTDFIDARFNYETKYFTIQRAVPDPYFCSWSAVATIRTAVS